MDKKMADDLRHTLAQTFFDKLKAAESFGGGAVTVDFSGLPRNYTYSVPGGITLADQPPPVVDVADMVEAGIGAGIYPCWFLAKHCKTDRICKQCGLIFPNYESSQPTVKWQPPKPKSFDLVIEREGKRVLAVESNGDVEIMGTTVTCNVDFAAAMHSVIEGIRKDERERIQNDNAPAEPGKVEQ